MIEDPCMKCGEESEVGCHGVTDNEVFDEYYCLTCYNKRD